MEIPPYPVARPLTLSDKALLDLLFNDLQPRVSELSFAALYLFRAAHDYRLATAAGSIIILGRGYDGSAYFLPPLGGDVAEALKIMFSHGQTLYGADDQFAARYLNGNSMQITELRDSCDYLYLREELATLPGSRFHKKKNRISYFTARHGYTVTLYSREHTEGCLYLLDKWFHASRNGSDTSLNSEMEAASEGLLHAEALGLEGVVITVNKAVAAFALGERLNRDTAVCHFEKADPFIEGVSQLINREFARLLFQECRYLNREQDLGSMGLRNAKLCYHQVELVNKYLVTVIQS